MTGDFDCYCVLETKLCGILERSSQECSGNTISSNLKAQSSELPAEVNCRQLQPSLLQHERLVRMLCELLLAVDQD